MDLFLYKYAELKIDVIDEQDGLEGRKVQTGSGLDDVSTKRRILKGIQIKKL